MDRAKKIELIARRATEIATKYALIAENEGRQLNGEEIIKYYGLKLRVKYTCEQMHGHFFSANSVDVIKGEKLLASIPFAQICPAGFLAREFCEAGTVEEL